MVERSGADWAQRLSAEIGRSIEARRKESGLLGRDIAQLTEALGVPITVSTLSKIESGKKAFLSVAELLLLARVLDTSPAMLVAPIRTVGGCAAETVEVLPSQHVSPDLVFGWITGHGATFVPTPLEIPTHRDADNRARKALEDHAVVVRKIGDGEGRVIYLRRARGTLDQASPDAAGIDQDIAAAGRELDGLVEQLRALRRQMSERGVVLPEVQARLAARLDSQTPEPWGV